MHKAAHMAIIFTFGLWTGGILAPNQSPAGSEPTIGTPQPVQAQSTPENPARVEP